MSINPLARFALAGLIGAGFGTHTACAAEGGDAMAGGDTGTESNEEKYREVHDCAGLNVCKGLGGCHVTDDKLAKLAEAAGVPAEEAGTAHDCAGLNACKGLGGCKVTAEKFAALKAKADAAAKEAEGATTK